MTYQKIILTGFLGNDPELRFTEQGVPVATFSLATKRVWYSNETKHEQTTWWRVECWRKTAEIASDYLKKGRQVQIECRMKPDRDTGNPRIWTDREGNPRASYEVTADRLILLSNRDGGQAQGNAPSDDDIPF